MSLKSNIWKVYLFEFFVSMHFISAVLIPFFTEWGNISFSKIMILQSWFMLWIFIFEIPTGAIADFLGRKKSMIIGAGANVIAVLIYSITPNYFLFLIGEIFFALSVSLISGSKEALIYDTLKKNNLTKDSKSVFGRSESFHLTGILVGAPIGSFIAFFLGVRYPMMLMSIPFMIAFVIGFTFKEPKIHLKQEKKNYFVILKSGVKFFYKHKILKILALDMVVISSIAYLMIWLYQPLLMRSGCSMALFGFVHAAFVIGEIVVMNNYIFLEKLFGSKKRVIFLSSIITGLMFILAGLTTFLPLVLLAIIVSMSFGLTRRPLLISYMNKYIPSHNRATVLSAISMLRRILIIVFNPIIGFFVDKSLNYALIILGLIAITFAVFSKVEEEHLID
ncbi:MAG: MFS transporter [Nanoarchaeota archaeon]|nr:MFS transporter [Nanoarchaeota archaeon]MBU1030000.1 MFS transporter [Nanoarchaeota archaeon]MBU1850186.1 MFS transporter [Nanoarchaeota archaeon]